MVKSVTMASIEKPKSQLPFDKPLACKTKNEYLYDECDDL
jgi:hypothetical protein